MRAWRLYAVGEGPFRLIAQVVCWCLLALCGMARAQLPGHYPADYGAVVEAARKEGVVVVYSTTDLSAVASLVRDFESLYPGVRVQYHKLISTDLYQRYLAETAAHRPTADVLWSSAMDLQIKLANDHHAATYRSPEAAALPDWAIWRDAAYGTTFEPAVFVYNKRMVTGPEIPQTHAEFAHLLATHRQKYAGHVTTYDIERSAVGFLFATQDSRVQPGFWDLARALGSSDVEKGSNTSAMVERIASGKVYLGYNLIGSYALTRARRDPSIGVVLPSDYTLVMSRIALVSTSAAHPNAARLWLDYLLSYRGQSLLANRAELFSVRGDVPGEFSAATLRQSLGSSIKAIGVGPSLLVFLDHAKRQEFLQRWRRETAPVK
nr:ABC transporter substrate-binding protein [Polaromonas jejuensis]